MTDRDEKVLSTTILTGDSRPIEDIAVSPAAPQPLTGLFHPEEYSPTFIGKPITALTRSQTVGVINSIATESFVIGDVTVTLKKEKQIIDKNGQKKTVYVKPGAGEAKLLRYAVSALTKINSQNTRNLSLTVYGDTKAYARDCLKDPARGIDPRPMATPEEQEKENQRAAKALENFVSKLKLNALLLTVSPFIFEYTYKGEKKGFGGITMLGAFDVNADVFKLEFTQSAALYFIHQPLSYTPRAFYAIDERKPNAIAIANELIQHYFNENNVIRNTERMLKVETLLRCTSLPTIDELTGAGGINKSGEKVKRKYFYRWEDRIKEPFEQALDELTRVGLIEDWDYRLAGKKPIPDGTPIPKYEQFISLYVFFEFNFDTHEHRLEHITAKRDEKKKQAAKKREETKRKKKEEATKQDGNISSP